MGVASAGALFLKLQNLSRVGPYELLSALGAGGMGSVYRARDCRLHREVALKILPEAAHKDPDRERRFLQEAEAASALTHPNILTVYDVGQDNDVLYIATELIDGQPLRSALQRGPLPLRTLLDVAAQIADGLAAAHDAGIVHRDLKPENIMVTANGRAKIVDFGLAKAFGGLRGHDDHAATMTAEGVILGTVPYMSPEQARGEAVDYRSDQFSFGVMLYEMATARQPFRRDSAVQTLSAIISEEPAPLSHVNPKLPVMLRCVIDRCLAKNVSQRYASTLDLARDLTTIRDRLAEMSAEAATAENPPARTSLFRVLAAALIATAIVLGGWARLSLGKGTGAPPHPTFRQLTFRRGGVVSARFTPDGKTVIYGAAWDGDPVRLFSTRIEGPESSPVPLPDADVADISSSAEMLIVINRPYLFALPPGTLAQVPLAGGTPRPIADGVSAADWSSDGKQFAISRFVGGTRARIEYPVGTLLDEDPEGAWGPRISPDGNHVAYYGGGRNHSAAVVMADRSGKRTVLSDGWLWPGRYLSWSPRGDEIWFSATKGDRIVPLRAVTRSGQERIVLNLPGSIQLQDISADGHVLLAYGNARREVRCRIANEQTERNLTWFGWSGAEWLSADGKTLLLHEWDGTPDRVPRAYLRRTDGSPAVRLGECVPIHMSPDGKWVACFDQKNDQVLLIPTGAGQPRRTARHGVEAAGFGYPWLPDSKHALEAWREAEGKPFRTYIVDIDGGPARRIAPDGFVCTWASPDGKSALCQPGADGLSHVYSLQRSQMRPVRGLRPTDEIISWAADGRSLFLRTRSEFPVRIYRLDIDTGVRDVWRQIDPPDRAGLFHEWITVYMTPDGSSYCYTTQNAVNDLYLVEGLR